MINRCRERDKLDETTEHVIARCSSLSESAYLGRHNKMAKIVRQQIPIKCMPFDRNIPPYSKHKPEPIVYWDVSIITDTTANFNRPDTVLTDRENKAALVIDITVHVTHKKKGKAVPLQAWSGPQGSRKLRFPDFVTTTRDSGKVVSLMHRSPLPPGNTPGTHFC